MSHPESIYLKVLPPFTLQVLFSDGAMKELDVSTLFATNEDLKPLSDPLLFKKGKLMGSFAIRWTDDIDISCTTVYDLGTDIERPSNYLELMVGYRIKKERLKKFWSQEELASKAKIDQSDLSKIEKGKLNPSLKLLKRISDALGKEIEIDLI